MQAAPVRLWAGLGVAAVTVPPLIAFNQSPSATFYNQAAALLGWGALLLTCAGALPAQRPRAGAGLRALLGALALVAAAAAGSAVAFGQPSSLTGSALALIAAAALAAWIGAALHGAGLQRPAFTALAVGLLGAGLLSAVVAIVQVFAPDLADSAWIAASATPGRAVGNLRQPNHLASLLLWAIIAAVWLAQARLLRATVAAACVVLLVLGVVLSASRTGIVGAALLCVWGLVDRRLTRAARVLTIVVPLLYALGWAGMSAWAHLEDHAFAGETRLTTGGDLSSSRFAIWSNTLALIRMVPWTGVGFGEFNFAWSLTPFPDRPVAFFDHTHNLLLHLLVELGLPLGALVLVLLLAALAAALRAAWRDDGDPPVTRAAVFMVLMIGVHSLLEYPLWYAYFLLPAAFAFGLALGRPDDPPRPRATWPAAAASLALMFGALAALHDYRRVVVIFAPPADAGPLALRLADGQRSWWFAHHADYAVATIAEHPSQVMPAFAGATHFLLDTRLMMAWARAYHEAGDTERALHLAARLREFRNPDADEFLAPCRAAPGAAVPAFPCGEPTRRMDWRDFR
jgi:O-antigen ligase